MSQKKHPILSIGTYLPENVRKNDWWPSHVVEKWKNEKGSFVRSETDGTEATTLGRKLALEGMAEFRADPFKGFVERRIRSTGMMPSEMEISASKDALDKAGVAGSKIGLILTASMGADKLMVSNAPLIHKAIGAPMACISSNLDAACNSLTVQLAMAEGLIRTGKVEYALLIQSCSLTSLCRPEDSFSPWFGDAATAVLVGACEGDIGVLALEHGTDGDYYKTLLAGNPAGSWLEGHSQHLYVDDVKVTRALAVYLPEMGCQTLVKAMDKLGIKATDLDFFATHQGAAWLRNAAQTLIGATNARSCDIYKWAASVGPSNVPLCLAMGEKEGLLKRGDLVGAWTGGAGTTFSAMVVRW